MSHSPRPPAEVVIGVDVGTTATKAVAFGLGSSWRHMVIREYPLLQPVPGRHVQDPETVIAAVLDAIAEVVGQAGSATVVALSLSSAMHGLIGLDAALRPLTPLVTWADARAAGEAKELRESGRAQELHLTSGTPVHPMSPLAKLIWFSRHEPKLAAKVRAWVGLKDYVLLSLTGTLATERSSASGTGLLDLGTLTWNPQALDLASVSEHQLPPVLSTTAELGLSRPVAQRVGRLPRATPVITGAADGPLGNLGAGALERGVVGLSVGTSGAVRMVVPKPARDESGRLFCYALTDDAWVVGGAVSNGGIAARWAGGVFGQGAVTGGGSGAGELLELAASIPAGSDGLVMLPYLLAERAPLWDPSVPGAFLGVRHSHTSGHFVRAAVEGVALQLSAIMLELERFEPVTSIRATGGVFRAPLWRSVMAAALGRPFTVIGRAEGSALGAAALGLLATGRAESLVMAVEQLAPGVCAGSGEVVPVSAQDLAAYERIRTDLPHLLSSYREVADLFASAPTDR